MENTGRAIIATMGWGDFRAFAIVYATSATFIAVKTRKMKDFFCLNKVKKINRSMP